MTHTACTAAPNRAEQARTEKVHRREAAYFERDRVINRSVLNVALRSLRLTRTRLAAELGMDRVHVGRVLAGEAGATPDFRYRLCQALASAHVEPDELFVAPGGVGADVALDDDDESQDGAVA